MEVYAFMFTGCIYESSYSPMSLHKTKAGAYKAMRNYLLNQYAKWFDMRTRYGKDKLYGTDKFGMHEDWCVQPYQIED